MRFGERGAALLTVLLFMVLVSILISSMLAVTGNEILISGAHRDGVLALELAQTGVAEAMRRIAAGHQVLVPFSSSFGPGVTVTVIRRQVGANAAYLEIQSTGTVGRAKRNLSALVVQMGSMYLPGAIFAERFNESGVANIQSGDVYSRTYVEYKRIPKDENSLTYAGWRIERTEPLLGPCYTNYQCANEIHQNPNQLHPEWFPATRLADGANSSLGQDILDWARQAEANDCNWPLGVPTAYVTPGEYLADNTAAPVVPLMPMYGFDTDDPDGMGGIPSQISPQISPCGLAYKWVKAPLPVGNEPDGDGLPIDPMPAERWFKHIVYEQWLENYWRFNDQQMAVAKRNGASPCPDAICLADGREPNLILYPQYGAVPPTPPSIVMEPGSYDRLIDGSGGGSVNGGSGDWGCKYPEMKSHANCAIAPANTDRPVTVWLTGLPEGQTWSLGSQLKGLGTLVIDGDVSMGANFEYWGTIIINGKFTLSGSGTARVTGGIVARDGLMLTASTDVWGGVPLPSAPVGQSMVVAKTWWER
jgi:hypothetical protein